MTNVTRAEKPASKVYRLHNYLVQNINKLREMERLYTRISSPEKGRDNTRFKIRYFFMCV